MLWSTRSLVRQRVTDGCYTQSGRGVRRAGYLHSKVPPGGLLISHRGEKEAQVTLESELCNEHADAFQ